MLNRICAYLALALIFSCFPAQSGLSQPEAQEQNQPQASTEAPLPSEPLSEPTAISLYNQSLAPLKDGRNEEAIALLRRAILLDANQPLFYCNIGLALLHTGDTDEALSFLERAVKMPGAIPETWLNLGLAFETKERYLEAINALEQYRKLKPGAADASRVDAHIARLKSLPSSKTSNEDYFSEVTQKYKLRWAPERMPLKVYIASGDKTTGFKPQFLTILREAMSTWSAASEGKISFKEVDNPANADLKISWTDDVKAVIDHSEGGHTNFVGNGQGMQSVDITFLVNDPSLPLNDIVMGWIARHEIGHSLGLLGHSTVQSDALFFTAPQSARINSLSDRDIKTLRRLYSEELGESPLVLNDEGVQFSQKGDLASAIKKYERALVLDPAQKEAHSNLVRACYKMALSNINSGKFAEAEPQLRRAMTLESERKDENYAVVHDAYQRLLKILKKAAK